MNPVLTTTFITCNSRSINTQYINSTTCTSSSCSTTTTTPTTITITITTTTCNSKSIPDLPHSIKKTLYVQCFKDILYLKTIILHLHFFIVKYFKKFTSKIYLKVHYLYLFIIYSKNFFQQFIDRRALFAMHIP